MKFNVLTGVVAVGGKSTVTQNPVKDTFVHHISAHTIKGVPAIRNVGVQHVSGHVIKGRKPSETLGMHHISAHVIKEIKHFAVHHVSAHVIYNGV